MLKIEKHARGINITEVKETNLKGNILLNLYTEDMEIQ